MIFLRFFVEIFLFIRWSSSAYEDLKSKADLMSYLRVLSY
jgi:hypothetical protein